MLMFAFELVLPEEVAGSWGRVGVESFARGGGFGVGCHFDEDIGGVVLVFEMMEAVARSA